MKPEIYVIKDNKTIEAHISTLGGTITRLITHTAAGPVDVVLGMEDPEDYQSDAYVASGAYLGAGIGRYANRIAGGKFAIDGKTYQLAVNNGPNHLHGGICGFDKKIWTVVNYEPTCLVLRYVSPDGEENYPGTLTVELTFRISERELHIEYKAETDKKCYVSLTHHPYFNLNPDSKDIRSHCLKLYTDKYLKTNDLIPDGTIVEATGDYDFTTTKALQGAIEHCGGLDDCFVFDNNGSLCRQAELSCAETGIKMYVCSDYPGLQVYTGRYLDVHNAKAGRYYGPYAGVALEAQYWPDSPNHPDFPSTLLSPGETYRKTVIFGFEN